MQKQRVLLTVISLFLCLIFSAPSLATQPAPPRDQPKFIVPVICGVIIIAVITVIIIGLVKMCKKIPSGPPPDPDDPPPPPPPPTNNPAITVYQHIGPMVAIEASDAGVAWYDVRGLGAQRPYESLMATSIQSSSDLTNWTTEVYLLGWTSRDTSDPVMLIAVYSPDWRLLSTRYGDVRTNASMGDLIPKRAPSMNYRMAIPKSFHQ